MDELAAAAFRDHYADVLRFVRRRVSSDEEAEDVAQSVFAQAAARLDPARQGSTPVLAWLYTVAQRRLVDEARKRSRRGVPLPLEAAAALPDEHPYGSDVSDALRSALGNLTEEQRDVVVLRLVEGWSFGQIATRLDISEAACKMRFRRGLSVVREMFEKEGITP